MMGETSDPPPRFANHEACSKSVCTGLCYNHHPFSDSLPIDSKEIESCVCSLHSECSKIYCEKDTCRCFWKMQMELFNSRDRLHKTQERHDKKCKNLKSENASLRASLKENSEPNYTEAVIKTFGKVLKPLLNLGNQVENIKKEIDSELFLVLGGWEARNKENEIEIERLKGENGEYKKAVEELRKEIIDLKRKVRPAPRSSSPIGRKNPRLS